MVCCAIPKASASCCLVTPPALRNCAIRCPRTRQVLPADAEPLYGEEYQHRQRRGHRQIARRRVEVGDEPDQVGRRQEQPQAHEGNGVRHDILQFQQSIAVRGQALCAVFRF